MSPELQALSRAGRQAAQAGNWAEVGRSANRLLKLDSGSAEGHFLSGLAKLATGQVDQAAKALSRALRADGRRYDAAIELAQVYANTLRHNEAAALLDRHVPQVGDSPLYLDRAGSTWTRLGMHDKAWPLYARANELQPGVQRLQANLADCSVFLGRIDEARELYRALLRGAPEHQRFHFQLSRIVQAGDSRHVDEMEAILARSGQPPERNIYLYYALGKELEDLGRWDEAFRYYALAGDAAAGSGDYSVQADIDLIDAIIDSCDRRWLESAGDSAPRGPVPIFVVGLPRTGTTLTDRILSSHPEVTSVDETHFLELAIEQAGGGPATGQMRPAAIRRAAARPGGIAERYLDRVAYKLDDAPYFVEKLPENLLYAGFIAHAWPQARIVCLRRQPMDACFAMYKQSFFRYAYRLDDLAQYYVAHDRLLRHWRELLGERLLEVEYERLVSDPDAGIRRLLEAVGLAFDPACLAFEKNLKATATASAAQVREKMHTRSIGRWRHFAGHLEPLRTTLAAQGIDVGD